MASCKKAELQCLQFYLLQLRKFARTLLLVCELGTAVVSFEQKPGDIIWASGSHQLHQDIQVVASADIYSFNIYSQ